MTSAAETGAASAQPSIPTCCSAFYELDWVRALAQDLFHPGGEELTLRTAAAMNLDPGSRLIDLGCGTGTSAFLLSESMGLTVSGVDLSVSNIGRAVERVASRNASVQFLAADVRHLPFGNQIFDAALAECTFSLFPDQAAVLREVRRVLKPGGRLGITDMAIGGALPAEMQEVLAPWTCLADATDEATYIARFEHEGYTVTDVADESAGLTELLLTLKRKLIMLGAGSLVSGTSVPDIDLKTVRYWLDQFKAQVGSGAVRYLRFQLSA